ncbi:MAG: nucleotide pyrophosphohydrolase [Candidatus Pacebacteria bacterium]|nr:nucleotide pyrophosphohydrolase [Candidatus Paceibacterota bacterium]
MLKDAQKEIHNWVKDYKVPYWSPLSQFARLAEEVGELGRLLNHLYGDKPKKETEARQELGKEIMDVMFTAMCIANAHGIDLDAEFKATMEKCRTRDKDRFEKKEV